MAVTFIENKNYYSANFKGKQFTYSINKFGPLAELIAQKSFEQEKKIFNYIEEYDSYVIIKIYHVPTDTVYDIYVDIEDLEKVQNYKWHINVPQNSRTLYVVNDSLGKLHRYLLDVTDININVDHQDRNGLNNRKANLRLTDTSTNKKNMDVRSDNKFGCNGISFSKNSYRASWQEDGKQRSKKFCINNYEDALAEAIAFRKQKELEFGYL